MYRYHIDFIDNTGNRAATALADTVGGSLISNTPRYNDAGADLAILEIAADDAASLDELLAADPNVRSYRVYDL